MFHADLKVTSGKQAGSLIQLPPGKFLVGREDDCQLRPNSDLVSRHHCVFTIDQHSVRLRDLGSTNGTLVNGQRIRGTVVLNNGDRVEIGKLDFEMVIHEISADETTPAMALNTETSIPTPPATVVPQTSEKVSTSDTLTDFRIPEEALPANGVAQPISAVPEPVAPPTGDTQYLNMQQQVPVGYPAGYPQQYMPSPYGYQGYPGMYPQMGYPPQMAGMFGQPGMVPAGYPQSGFMPQGYPQPGYSQPGYPQQAYPQSAVEEAPPEESNSTANAIPVKLPDPATTGAAPVEAKQPGSGGKKDDKMNDKAADIIRKYQQRKPV